MTFTRDSRVAQWLTRDRVSEVYHTCSGHSCPSPKVYGSDVFSSSSGWSFLPICFNYFCASFISVDPSSCQFWWLQGPKFYLHIQVKQIREDRKYRWELYIISEHRKGWHFSFFVRELWVEEYDHWLRPQMGLSLDICGLAEEEKKEGKDSSWSPSLRDYSCWQVTLQKTLLCAL